MEYYTMDANGLSTVSLPLSFSILLSLSRPDYVCHNDNGNQ